MSTTAHNALGRIMLTASPSALPSGTTCRQQIENETWKRFRNLAAYPSVGLQSGNSHTEGSHTTHTDTQYIRTYTSSCMPTFAVCRPDLTHWSESEVFVGKGENPDEHWSSLCAFSALHSQFPRFTYMLLMVAYITSTTVSFSVPSLSQKCSNPALMALKCCALIAEIIVSLLHLSFVISAPKVYLNLEVFSLMKLQT